MEINEEEARALRDELHNLDIENPLDQAFYYKKLYNLIASGEGFSGEVYKDTRGINTIGYGFNMDRGKSAEKEWNQCLGGEVSFDDAINGKATITKEQGQKLMSFAVRRREKELAKIYEPFWDKMRLNERAVITDLYYQSPKLAGAKTGLRKNMQDYYQTNDPEHLRSAYTEIKERSSFSKNPREKIGLQNRNDIRSTIFNSEQCPLYSKPADALIPARKQIEIIPGKTVIRRKVSKTYPESNKLDDYYIWRTRLDDKVRTSHSQYEGKVFRHKDNIYHPGEDFGCRCYKQKLPIHAKIIEPDAKADPDYHHRFVDDEEDNRKVYLLNSNHQIKIFNG